MLHLERGHSVLSGYRLQDGSSAVHLEGYVSIWGGHLFLDGVVLSLDRGGRYAHAQMVLSGGPLAEGYVVWDSIGTDQALWGENKYTKLTAGLDT